ncbi:synaptonemal complex central element protein 3 [Bufo bufo]|uniref:synaptonemal complex central element protein 3 n=1 Tax=Bufo bufo TaxID=8384 RepID=UPI001ABEA953|nr:synaptonemal complex central element protein 3 [Bufo bufo]
MAEANPNNRTCEGASKILKDLDKDMERMLEQMEKISVKTTWMVYEMVATQRDPALVDQVRRLEESFLQCREEIEKKWKEMLDETKKTS